MTGTAPDPRHDHTDPRLRALDDTLLTGLTAHLDVEAGLRDALLHAQPAASAPPNCHPDRSSPAFSCARFVSAGPRSGGTVAAKSASTSHDVTG